MLLLRFVIVMQLTEISLAPGNSQQSESLGFGMSQISEIILHADIEKRLPWEEVFPDFPSTKSVVLQKQLKCRSA